MVVRCLLCLENPIISCCRFIRIYSEEGLGLNVAYIINKYFWFEANRVTNEEQLVCFNCWSIVREFHQLHQRVEYVHNNLKNTLMLEDSPSPSQGVLIKSEATPFYSLNNDNAPVNKAATVFNSELKVAENVDLQILPQIECVETVANTSLFIDESCVPTADHFEGENISDSETSNESIKRIKREYNSAENYKCTTQVFNANESLDVLESAPPALEPNLKNNKKDTARKKKYNKISVKNFPSSNLGSFDSSNVNDETEKIRMEIILMQQRLELMSQSQIERSKESEELAEVQLFGKSYTGEPMVHLRNDIYCRKSVYDIATGCSFKSTHVARRLLDGVFKPEAILKSTLTGQSTKSHGKERQMEKFDCLDNTAKAAIIEFSIEFGIKKGWPPQSMFDIKRALSQRIGEIKRQVKKKE